MSLSDFIISWIRTAVPAGVGAVLAFLSAKAGVVIDEATSTAGVVFFTGILSAAYYAAVRLLEARWPWFGLLLLAKRPPSYAPAE